MRRGRLQQKRVWKGSALNMSNLRCLLDIQVEKSGQQLNTEFIVQALGWRHKLGICRHLLGISAMRMDTTTKAVSVLEYFSNRREERKGSNS